METQQITIMELVTLVLYMGSIVYIIGASYQFIALKYFNKNIRWFNILSIIIITRILTLSLTMVLWQILFQEIDILYGPVLLPALISEILLSPLVLKIGRFRLFPISKKEL